MSSREQANTDLFMDFAALKRAMMREAPLVHLHIPPAQKEVMFALSHHEGMKVKEIAENLGITPGAATQLTEALVQSGLLERHADASDRRIVRVQHSPKGMQEMEKLRTARESLAKQMFSDLSDEEIKSFHRIIKKMKENLENDAR